MTDAFISYSRRNLDFVNRLSDVLEARDKSVWFDKKKEPLEGIPVGSKWWDEIIYGIEQADNFLFIISPESIGSPYCNAEVAHALKMGRRMVTILYCGEAGEGETLEAVGAAIEAIPEDAELPESVWADEKNQRRLTRTNWLAVSGVQYVVARDVYGLESVVEQAISALDLDLEWIRMRVQIQQGIQLWLDHDRDEDLLWSDVRLSPIREMVERVGAELTELEEDFLRINAEWLIGKLYADLDHEGRARIGVRLAEMGDPRSGVGLVAEDLSLGGNKQEVRLWGMESKDVGLPDIVWCPISMGQVEIKWMKNNPIFGSLEKTNVFHVDPFLISKYSITYGQYKVFIEAEDGIKKRQWWDGLAAWSDDMTYTSASDNQWFQYDNHPVEGVCWYDAMAFCRWLSFRTGKNIRLPTEWEWQWVAQGVSDAWKHPFRGWDKVNANIFNSGLKRTTSVGIYPEGRAANGAMDMFGNIDELCFNRYELTKDSCDVGSNKERVIRGGSWEMYGSMIKSDYRREWKPSYTSNTVGFRVVAIDMN